MYKISIITATYNSGRTLEQTISSVVEQDYPNIEYIIIDGKSTDNTLDIIERYADKGIKYISEVDEGIYDAFNKGIEIATGDYILFLGSDDSLCSKDIISKVSSRLDDNIDILSAAVMVVDEKSGKQYPIYNHHALDKIKYPGGMIPHQGMFVKTSLQKKYKFDTKYKVVADYKFFLQCYYDINVRFKFIDDPVVYFTNNGVSSNREICCAENNRVYEELGLPFHDSMDSNSLWKKYLKLGLYKMNMLAHILKLKAWCRCMFIWEKHRCDNKICRWCGRL